MSDRVKQLEHALLSVLNYWEPACMSDDCDKGYHVEAFRVWKQACELVNYDPEQGYDTRSEP